MCKKDHNPNAQSGWKVPGAAISIQGPQAGNTGVRSEAAAHTSAPRVQKVAEQQQAGGNVQPIQSFINPQCLREASHIDVDTRL